MEKRNAERGFDFVFLALGAAQRARGPANGRGAGRTADVGAQDEFSVDAAQSERLQYCPAAASLRGRGRRVNGAEYGEMGKPARGNTLKVERMRNEAEVEAWRVKIMGIYGT